ncbi:thiamine diphosphokinase [Peptoniphilus catoniae]|uniref:thiamine diphosphokinase n=1 Tax=Peptoniphilus catoniae TaxID=1660341 RepID=UPI0010FDA603|nr:thiamine diphosphokinase [Peptoniphilus catoniae]
MLGLLVSGGKQIDKSILKKYAHGAYIVCADYGVKNFIGTDFIPNLVVGDLDSIDEDCKKFIYDNKLKVKKLNCRKDYTDTEVALNLILESGVDEIVMLSATGSRMDHSLANLMLLRGMYGKVDAKIIDNNNEVFYVKPGDYLIEKEDYKYISIVPLSEDIIMSSKGLDYETDHLRISLNSSTGVSNEIVNCFANIKIHSGDGFIIKSKD